MKWTIWHARSLTNNSIKLICAPFQCLSCSVQQCRNCLDQRESLRHLSSNPKFKPTKCGKGLNDPRRSEQYEPLQFCEDCITLQSHPCKHEVRKLIELKSKLFADWDDDFELSLATDVVIDDRESKFNKRLEDLKLKLLKSYL